MTRRARGILLALVVLANPGGTAWASHPFGPPQPVAPDTEDVESYVGAADRLGSVYALVDGTGGIQVRVRRSGGTFGEAASTGTYGEGHAIAVGRSGHVLAAWGGFGTGAGDGGAFVNFAGPGGGFGPSERPPIAVADAAVAADGTAVLVGVGQVGEGPDARFEVHAVERSPAGQWSESQPLSSAGFVRDVDVAIDEEGRATAMWVEYLPHRLLVSTREPGGRFSTPRVLSPPGDRISRAKLAAGGNGDAVVAWLSSKRISKRGRPLKFRHWVRAAARRDGGRFGPAVKVSPAGVFELDVEMNDSGGALLAYRLQRGYVRALRYSARSGWGRSQRLSRSGIGYFAPHVGFTGSGAGVVLWMRPISAEERVLEAAFRPRRAARFGTPERISRGLTRHSQPQLALGPGDSATAFWLSGYYPRRLLVADHE